MVYTNADLNKFLRALDSAPFEVDDWEAQFVESNLERTFFTEPQRQAILKMIEKYGQRLKW